MWDDTTMIALQWHLITQGPWRRGHGNHRPEWWALASACANGFGLSELERGCERLNRRPQAATISSFHIKLISFDLKFIETARKAFKNPARAQFCSCMRICCCGHGELFGRPQCIKLIFLQYVKRFSSGRRSSRCRWVTCCCHFSLCLWLVGQLFAPTISIGTAETD